ncbi:CcdB family protein [Novosphingobium sp.]|uniref:CcdB family protein n=1 Tax=Novosphingobium sp. TaxID=1874826 RepID=UPI0025DEB105|nr:CcdB family protein [Novosphingobium sp.]MCC6926627.1 CcdB family protein [Novosphingobium sp.]
MARYSVYRLRTGELAIDCQADILEHLGSRFVVPLVNPKNIPDPIKRLHPLFEINGQGWIMATHMATAIKRKEIEATVCSLRDEDRLIDNALDFLITGV